MSSTPEKATAHAGVDGKLVSQHSVSTPTPEAKPDNVDAAWTYLDTHREAANQKDSESVDLATLRRKIDWHIVPLMFCCYTMQFLDKVILNYAGVMTIRQDLNLQGNDFSNVATFLFVGLLCFEIPNSACCLPCETE
jgi:hypothetical protein